MEITEVRAVAAEAKKALEAELGDRYVVTQEHGSYDRDGATLKFTVRPVGVAAPQEAALARVAAQVGLPADVVGKSFRSGGKVHTITGWNRNARRRPVMTKADDGKQYSWELEAVQKLLAAA